VGEGAALCRGNSPERGGTSAVRRIPIFSALRTVGAAMAMSRGLVCAPV
jgi:hypothetical protein